NVSFRLNNVTMIPPEFSTLTNLETLHAGFNNITEYPESLSSLKNLRALNLEYNLLTSLPLALISYQRIIYFSISGNRWKYNRRASKYIKFVEFLASVS